MANTTANLLFSVSLLKPIRKKKTQASWKGPTSPVSIVWVDRKGLDTNMFSCWHFGTSVPTANIFKQFQRLERVPLCKMHRSQVAKKMMALEVFFKNI